MGIHTAGGHQTALSINNLAAFGGSNFGANRCDFAVVINQNTAVGDIGSCHGLDVSVFNEKHIYILLCIIMRRLYHRLGEIGIVFL